MSSVTVGTLADSNVTRNISAPSSDTTSTSSSQPSPLPNVLEFTDEDLVDKKFIGTGGYGKVYRCRWKNSTNSIRYVAEKQIITMEHLKKEAEDSLRQEASILGSTQHTNIVKLLGILYGAESFSLIMEYMEYGSCCEFFRIVAKGITDEDKWPLKFKISEQVCEALEFLHSKPKKILHLDLKSRNVLLDKRLNAKLCDFGLSQLKTLSRLTRASAAVLATINQKAGKKQAKGTITHIAPEHLSNINLEPTTKTDVYSYGIFLWEVLTEEDPYTYNCLPELIQNSVMNGQRPDRRLIPRSAPDLLKDLMVKAWDGVPSERPEFKDILGKLRKDTEITQQQMESSIKRILMLVPLGDDDISKSDSQIVMSPPQKDPHPGTTRSEGESRAIRLPDQVLRRHTDVDSGETMAKEPLVGTGPGSRHTVPFFTQNLPSAEPPSTSHETDITSRDLLFSDVTEPPTDDAEPLIVGPSEENGKKRKKRLIILFCAFGLILVGVVIYLVLCFTRGCFASCPILQERPHQIISCQENGAASSSNQFKSGSKCMLSCDKGFGIKTGKSQLTCQSNGKWSSSQPNCSALRFCNDLAKPANGGSYNCTDDFYEMSVCTFSCPEGSHLHLPDTSNVNSTMLGVSNEPSTTCTGDSGVKWSSPVPYCEEETSCPALPTPTAGSYSCSDSSTLVNSVVNDAPHSNGTKCRLVCDSHFAVKGPSTLVCQTGGKWNNTTPSLVCMRECPSIPLLNGSVTCTQNLFVGSVCKLSCNANFVLVGYPSITCINTGMWTHPPPQCVCPACRTGRKCEYSMTWVDTLAQMNKSFITSKTFKYGDHEIQCYQKTVRNRPAATLPGANLTDAITNASCVCKDVPANKIQQCNGPSTLQAACETALSSLILKLVFAGMYTLPCDADVMPPSCVK